MHKDLALLRFPALMVVAFITLVALAGGSSRYDLPGQTVVRLGALALITVLVLLGRRPDFSTDRRTWLFLGVVTMLIVLQLVPLPPVIWTALPGRAEYAEAAIAAGIPQPWRPISLTPQRTWNALLAMLPPAAMLFAMGYLSARERSQLLVPVALLILTSAVLGLLQLVDGPASVLRWYATATPNAGVGFFANRNHQALLLALGIPCGLAWALARANVSRHPALAWTITGLVTIFLILMLPSTGSRSGLVLGAFAIVATLALSVRRIAAATAAARPRFRALLCLGAILAVVAVIGVAMTYGRAAAVQRLFTEDVTSDMRLRILQPVLDMIVRFAPIGSGFGTFDPVFRRFEPTDVLQFTYMNQVHNDYLQIALEAGVVGILLLIVGLAWFIVRSWKLWINGEGTGTALLGSAAIGLIMVASVTDYPARTPLFMVLTVIFWCWMLQPNVTRASFGPRTVTGAAV